MEDIEQDSTYLDLFNDFSICIYAHQYSNRMAGHVLLGYRQCIGKGNRFFLLP